MSDRLLITGASGLVGANLVRTLHEQGRIVRALIHIDHRALDGLDIETIQADIRNQEALERVMVGVDVVYHLAGFISLEMDTKPEMMAINTQGTRSIVNACLKCGVRRLIHFSSIDALQPGKPHSPIVENQPLVDSGISTAELARIPPYSLSKALAEREVMSGAARGLDTVILRPTAILGPYDFKPSILGQALLQLARGRIPALVKAGFDWVDVRDVVAGAISAEQAAPPGSIYMLSGNWHTMRDVADMVSAYTNRPTPWLTVPMWLADASAPVMLNLARINGQHPIYTHVTLTALKGNRHVSSSLAVHDLEYTSRPLAMSVRDTLTWFEENGYLRGSIP